MREITEHIRQQKRDWAKNNRDIENARQRKWKEENPERWLLLQKSWKDRNQQYDSNWRKNHIEHKREYDRKWRAKNRIKEILRHHKRRSTLSQLKTFSEQEWIELCEKYNNLCLRCKRNEKLTIDHIIPLSKNGDGDISNIQPLCKQCNTSKGIKIVDYR